MDTSKATARPWRVAINDNGVFCGIFDSDGNAIGVTLTDADGALIVRAVNSHEALVAALRSIPPSPVSRPVTSAEWEVADRFYGFFDAFEGPEVRSIRSAAYERGMKDGKHARAALALAEHGGG